MLGHPPSSHGLSPVLKLFRRQLKPGASKLKFYLGGRHYGCFSGKIFAPTKEPHRNPISLPALAAKLDKFTYTRFRIYVKKKTLAKKLRATYFCKCRQRS